MAVANHAGAPARTYGNWRRPTSPGLWQLGALGTGLLLFFMIIEILLMATAGLVPALVGALIGGVAFLVLTVKDRHRRSIAQRVTARVAFRRHRKRGHNLYRSGPLGQLPWGSFQMPGLAAPSRLSEWTDSYGRKFALIHVPSTGDFTVVFSTEPDGASLVDAEQVDSWVANWGAWLANLANEPGAIAAAVTVETAPDTGTRLRREVEAHVDPDAPLVAQAMLREVVDTYPEGSATVKAWVSVTFAASVRAGARKRTPEEMGRDLASRLPALSQSLHATGAGGARPVTAAELCEMVRVAYDPQAARLLDAARAAGESPQLQWGEVGPATAEEHYDHYRHDSAVSVTWAMSSAPRGEVYSSVLRDLLAPHRDVDRKRVTLLYRPLSAARAAHIVEQDRRAADFRATASPRPSARAQIDQRAAHQAAEEEARGAGLVNFGMVVTATVTSSDRLPDARAAIDNLSAAARVLLRPVYGSQGSAFAAALPIGLVLPRHLRVPQEIRESL